ncbi:hypothetical protein [Spiroplasma tabanidicola]|uniref:Uncharacterized protein n=1 Tax=Spiroplasma tabanidicola TaxID=324079 RepID=A0A6I6CD03_9MOLU|nr:hypothetical protein [Spiroplasma tabanidicola]QGS51854.1 hypothetical protein STABA_v1c04910 [Spiroplasma tabanidicola]
MIKMSIVFESELTFTDYIKQKIKIIENENDNEKVNVFLIELIILVFSYFEHDLKKHIVDNFDNLECADEDFKNFILQRLIFFQEKESIIIKIEDYYSDKEDFQKFNEMIKLCSKFFDKDFSYVKKYLKDDFVHLLTQNKISKLIENAKKIKKLKIELGVEDDWSQVVNIEVTSIEDFYKNELSNYRNKAVHNLQIDDNFYNNIYKQSKLESWFLKVLEVLNIIKNNFFISK